MSLGANLMIAVSLVAYAKLRSSHLRVQKVIIHSWRHFSGVEFTLRGDAPLVCIVGGNGAGKSQILELIAACSKRIGLASGWENLRGDPFGGNPSFNVTFFIAPETIDLLDRGLENPDPKFREACAAWDRTITVSTDPLNGLQIKAGGVAHADSTKFANYLVEIIHSSQSIHYLFLDADRSYPKMEVSTHQLGEVIERDWDSTKKQSSFRSTRNLYEEWFRYLIGKENRESNKYVQQIRLARSAETPEPSFVDHLSNYRESVKSVLPHLMFVGVDQQAKQPKFDSTGVSLTFDQLSGGEREISFLVGQIDRFGLRRGMLLIDEPELHLNYDLLRTFMGFLKKSVEKGQIWLATHSLEVVEVAGQDATILLHRDDQSRRVVAASPLSEQPVIASLSRAIGSPAFSISNLAFVMIEGEEEIGERERFRILCEMPPHIRFLESGSCKELIRRIAQLRELATASGQSMRIGGIVDRDWRARDECDELRKSGLFVIGVHEVENFFLHPQTLMDYLQTNGSNPNIVDQVIRDAADRRAGSWVFNSARSDRKFRDFPKPSETVRTLAHRLEWSNFVDINKSCDEIAQCHGELSSAEIRTFRNQLVANANIFDRKRKTSELWKICEGKEVFRSIVTKLGLSNEDSAERAITAVWRRNPALIPQELLDLRAYLNQI